MYCAYTIPGITGGSLMYYYNGKAVSQLSSTVDSSILTLSISTCILNLSISTWSV
uniref:Uncharacterized protein n=1 Tax=Salmo trutta TaxID=8032 RepID=A0A674A1Z7_SALTR